MMNTAKIVATNGSIRVINVALLASIKFKPKPNNKYPKNIGIIAIYKDTKVLVELENKLSPVNHNDGSNNSAAQPNSPDMDDFE